eukprot:5676938-Ditylum_brightwellii.AAC.1
MDNFVSLTAKRDTSIKARACANGSMQHSHTSKDKATSPIAATDTTLLTGAIEENQNCNVITMHTLNTFVQTNILEQEQKIIVKTRGLLVDILLELCLGVYDNFVVMEGNQNVLYVQMLKTLYGMLVSSILFYKKFRRHNKSIGFK